MLCIVVLPCGDGQRDMSILRHPMELCVSEMVYDVCDVCDVCDV